MNKIKLIIFLYKISGGGAERTIINIISYIDKTKYEPIFILGSDLDNVYSSMIPEGVKVIHLCKNKLRNCILPLRKILINEKPNLVFSTLTDYNIALLIANFLTFLKIPAVVRVTTHLSSERKIRGIKKFIMSFCYNILAKRVIALSNGVKKDLIENHKICEDKISVIYNPVDIIKINTLKSEKLDYIEKNPNEKIIISIGRLEAVKDFITLLKAFKIIQNSVNSKLIILGQGSLESDLKTYCKKNQIDEKVYFAGFQLNPYKYLNSSDLFILTSKYEGFGHVIVEAMAVGVPVIVTNCPTGPYEIIGNNQYGRLVDVGDYKQIAVEGINLINNKELYEKYQKQGINRVNEFDAKNIVKQYEELFSEVVGIRSK